MLDGQSAHAFVADLDRPELTADDHHHLARVLRLRPGQEVTVGDGAGGWRRAVWTAAAALEPVGEVQREPRRDPPITVAFAIAKGDRPEWAVQKLTEAGVDRIVPLTTHRSVVRWEGERAERHTARLRRVAREAAMQSRQPWLPVVDDPTPFGQMAHLPGATMAEMAGGPPSLLLPTILVGPEGGWTEDELATGLPRTMLGPTVFRTETAAVAGGILLTALRAGLVQEPPSAARNELRLC